MNAIDYQSPGATGEADLFGLLDEIAADHRQNSPLQTNPWSEFRRETRLDLA